MHALPSRPVTQTLLSGGFRLFFPGSAVVAALVVAIWLPWYLGLINVPTALPPLAWHQHELLFGFVPGVVAGFLLTAVPNWTGRPTIKGGALLAIFLLWVAGRIAISLSGFLGPMISVPIALSFLPVFAVVIARELAAAGNRRNYKIVVILVVLSLAQVIFHLELQHFGDVLLATRLALATIVLMISLVAGRIVPSFTGNWLKANKPGRLPTTFSRFDAAILVLSLFTLLCWTGVARASGDLQEPIGMLMFAAGLAHLLRQSRWCPDRTMREPLLWILHVGYLFVPIGFLLTGGAMLLEEPGLATAGVHAWTAGAIGIMTLAVMTRATRGHTGQALHAPWTTVLFIYLPILLSATVRIAAAVFPVQTQPLLSIAGGTWVLAFAAYAVLYAPLHARLG